MFADGIETMASRAALAVGVAVVASSCLRFIAANRHEMLLQRVSFCAGSWKG